MEKVERDVMARYTNIQLFAPDIEELYRLLAQYGRKVTMVIDDWRLGIDELPDLAAKQAVAERIYFASAARIGEGYRELDIQISFQMGFGTLTADGPTGETRGIVSQIAEYMNKCKVDVGDDGWAWNRQRWDTVVLSPRPVTVKLPNRPAPTPPPVAPTPAPTITVAPSQPAATGAPQVLPAKTTPGFFARQWKHIEENFWKSVFGAIFGTGGLLTLILVALHQGQQRDDAPQQTAATQPVK